MLHKGDVVRVWDITWDVQGPLPDGEVLRQVHVLIHGLVLEGGAGQSVAFHAHGVGLVDDGKAPRGMRNGPGNGPRGGRGEVRVQTKLAGWTARATQRTKCMMLPEGASDARKCGDGAFAARRMRVGGGSNPNLAYGRPCGGQGATNRSWFTMDSSSTIVRIRMVINCCRVPTRVANAPSRS